LEVVRQALWAAQAADLLRAALAVDTAKWLCEAVSLLLEESADNGHALVGGAEGHEALGCRLED